MTGKLPVSYTHLICSAKRAMSSVICASIRRSCLLPGKRQWKSRNSTNRLLVKNNLLQSGEFSWVSLNFLDGRLVLEAAEAKPDVYKRQELVSLAEGDELHDLVRQPHLRGGSGFYGIARIPITTDKNFFILSLIHIFPMVVPEINADHIEIIPAQRKRLGTKRGFIAVKSNCSLQSYVPAPVSYTHLCALHAGQQRCIPD